MRPDLVFRGMTTLSALAFAVVGMGTSAAADPSYPTRPIRLVVPFPSGSNIDGNARQIAPALSDALGQQVVIDNRPGASGTIGAGIVAKAAADGYTVLMGNAPTHGLAPSVYKRLAYDPIKDFTPIGRLSTSAYVLAVSAALPVKSVSQLIAHAKARPGKLNYGSTGNGTGVHLAGVLFTTRAELDLRHIPYNNVSQIFVDMASGELAMMFYPYKPLIPMLQAGKVRLLAVTTPKRVSYLPDLPTAIEAGLTDFLFFAWHGFYGPAGMPPDRVQTFYHALLKAIADPKVAQALLATGVEVDPLPATDFAAFTRSEIARYRQLVTQAGVEAR